MSSQSSASLPGLESAGVRVERPKQRPAVKWGWGRLPVWLRRGILLAGLIGVWQGYIQVKHVNPLLFAGPWAVAKAFWHGWTTGQLAHPTVVTLKLLGTGMAIGTTLATVLVILATWTKLGEDLLALFTAMLNPLPAIAILPLAILWFGLNTNALLFVIANAVTWPIAINVAMGFKTVNQAIVAVGRNIGLASPRLVLEVLVPAALPHGITGFKTAYAFGWRTIIAAELVFGAAGSKAGLGYYINNARLYFETANMFAAIVTIALIGIAFDGIFTLLERRTVVRWGMKTTR
jgi:NitT/TauT family transport system permease protein